MTGRTVCHRRRIAETPVQRHGFEVRHLAVHDTGETPWAGDVA